MLAFGDGGRGYDVEMKKNHATARTAQKIKKNIYFNLTMRNIRKSLVKYLLSFFV